MNRIIRVLIVIIALTVSGHSVARAQGIYYGVKAGVNLTDVSDRINSDAKFGVNFGGLAGYRISSNLAVQLELLYSFQGYVSGNDSSLPVPEAIGDGANVNIDYFKVPALAKIYLYDGLNVEAGVSFNFLSSARSGGRSVPNIHTFDLSIPVGLAYTLTDNIEIYTRYEFSLTSLSKLYNGGNRVWTLGVAWRFL